MEPIPRVGVGLGSIMVGEGIGDGFAITPEGACVVKGSLGGTDPLDFVSRWISLDPAGEVPSLQEMTRVIMARISKNRPNFLFIASSFPVSDMAIFRSLEHNCHNAGATTHIGNRDHYNLVSFLPVH